VVVQALFLLVTDAAAIICWFMAGDIFKRRAHSGFVAEDSQIRVLLSLPHDRSPSPLGTPPVTNQQVSYAHVLRTGMTTGMFNMMCVQECGLLRLYAGCRRPETMLMGTDLAPSMYVDPFLPLAMVILLPTLGQQCLMSYLTDNLSDRNINLPEHYYTVVAQLNVIHCTM